MNDKERIERLEERITELEGGKTTFEGKYDIVAKKNVFGHLGGIAGVSTTAGGLYFLYNNSNSIEVRQTDSYLSKLATETGGNTIITPAIYGSILLGAIFLPTILFMLIGHTIDKSIFGTKKKYKN